MLGLLTWGEGVGVVVRDWFVANNKVTGAGDGLGNEWIQFCNSIAASGRCKICEVSFCGKQVPDTHPYKGFSPVNPILYTTPVEQILENTRKTDVSVYSCFQCHFDQWS